MARSPGPGSRLTEPNDLAWLSGWSPSHHPGAGCVPSAKFPLAGPHPDGGRDSATEPPSGISRKMVFCLVESGEMNRLSVQRSCFEEMQQQEKSRTGRCTTSPMASTNRAAWPAARRAIQCHLGKANCLPIASSTERIDGRLSHPQLFSAVIISNPRRTVRAAAESRWR